MRSPSIPIGDDTPVAAIVRQAAAEAVQAFVAEMRRRPLVQPEWLSGQDAATYTGYSEAQFQDFIKRGIAPPSVLFSRSARRFRREDLDEWCKRGGPSQFSQGGEGAVRE